MKKKMRRCKKCKCLFHVCTKVKKHEYCQKKECQRARKRRWQREKIKNDQQYRIDQKQAQKDWINATPEYWKEYRNNNPKYVLRNKQKQRQRNKTHRKEAPDETIAKMDALTQKNNVISG